MNLKKRIQIIKSDKVLLSILLIHLLLAFFHFAYSFYTDYWQCYVRAGFCLIIALSTFIWLRNGFSISILLYGYTLLYFNNFYNYTSFLFVLFAVYCSPKISKPALVLYFLNVFLALAFRKNEILTLGIHFLNCFLFYTCAKYLFASIAPATLMLTDDERLVLRELANGKLQKEIKEFSENRVTQIIKNAMSRNNCKSKAELLQKFIREHPQDLRIESQDA